MRKRDKSVCSEKNIYILFSVSVIFKIDNKENTAIIPLVCAKVEKVKGQLDENFDNIHENVIRFFKQKLFTKIIRACN